MPIIRDPWPATRDPYYIYLFTTSAWTHCSHASFQEPVEEGTANSQEGSIFAISRDEPKSWMNQLPHQEYKMHSYCYYGYPPSTLIAHVLAFYNTAI